MRKKLKIVGYLRNDRVVADACPNCGRKLDHALGIQFGGERPNFREKKGYRTVCGFCAAVLVFADDAGHVRVMTAADAAIAISPQEKSVIAALQKQVASEFTSRRGRSKN